MTDTAALTLVTTVTTFFTVHAIVSGNVHVTRQPAAAIREYMLHEEKRAHATESYCTDLNSTTPVGIDLETTPNGFLTSHQDFFSSWAGDNVTDEGLPIICKWRLIPGSSNFDQPIGSRTDGGDGKRWTTYDQVSFTFEALDLPLESYQQTALQEKDGMPGFRCAWTFIRLYLIDAVGNRQVLTEFCGRGWMPGFDVPVMPGQSILVHSKILQPYRGFRIYYETNTCTMPTKEADVSHVKAVESDDKTIKAIVMQDETYKETEMIPSSSEQAGNTSDTYDEACLSENGLVLKGFSGKIRFVQPLNSSVWCRWVLQPALEPEQQLKYIKFRLSKFFIEKSPAPCHMNVLDVSFTDMQNVTRTNTYCELKLPQPNKWQKADVLESLKVIFRSKSTKSNGGFQLDYYTVLISQAFIPKTGKCGHSLFRDERVFRPEISTNETLLVRNKRVVGGAIARPGNWPWISMLSFFGYQLCAATILNERWLLTAAHCFKNERKNTLGWEVIIGKQTSDLSNNIGWDYRTMALRPTIELILTHYRYGRSRNRREYDIALVKVEQPIPFGRFVSPICPPTVNNLTSADVCYIAGWGDTNDTERKGFLNEARVPIIPVNQCRTLNSYYNAHVSDTMLCAGYPSGGVDNCRGDNGGPLMCKVNGRWELHGIISWGKGCARKGAPGVYTRVHTHLHWIQKVINTYQ